MQIGQTPPSKWNIHLHVFVTCMVATELWTTSSAMGKGAPCAMRQRSRLRMQFSGCCLLWKLTEVFVFKRYLVDYNLTSTRRNLLSSFKDYSPGRSYKSYQTGQTKMHSQLSHQQPQTDFCSPHSTKQHISVLWEQSYETNNWLIISPNTQNKAID